MDDLKVDESRTRQGYGSALLKAVAVLAATPGAPLPVTPLHETWVATGFWDRLRGEAVAGLVVTLDVRASEMSAEARRWRQL